MGGVGHIDPEVLRHGDDQGTNGLRLVHNHQNRPVLGLEGFQQGTVLGSDWVKVLS